jgi:fermentation-respiration switch protein FrsA (DUF1100 family)
MGCSVSSLVFQPPTQKKVFNPHLVFLQTENNNLIPAKFFNDGQEFTILMSHGNAEDITRVDSWVSKSLLKHVKANVLIYEYSGYFSSEIDPNESYVYKDAEAAFSFLVNTIGVPSKKIVAYGRSLGSGPSCFLAEKYDLGGLILQTPFTSIYRVVLDFRFTLPGDMFPNVDRIDKIKCPLLVMHGTRDEIVPMQHSVDLFETSGSKVKTQYFVEGAGHNNIESIAGTKLFEHMQFFLDNLKHRV